MLVWLRNLIAAGLAPRVPTRPRRAEKTTPRRLETLQLEDGWDAVLDGPDVAALAQDPRGTPVSITDSRGTAWTATITEVVSRNQQRIVVRDAGRP